MLSEAKHLYYGMGDSSVVTLKASLSQSDISVNTEESHG